MEQSLHWNWFEAEKNEHYNENEVSFVFSHLTICSIFASILFLVFKNCKLFCCSTIYFYKFASKIIMFQEALWFRATIVFCYSQQTIVRIIGHVPPPLAWHKSQIIVDVLFAIVSVYVLN
jgi:hypothetical protein